MLENIRGHSRGSIPPLRMPSPLPHDLCHEWNVSRRLPAKDDAVKVLHSTCQQIWKTQQWPQDWKRSVFIPIPKKGKAKECSNYCTIALLSHANKVMLKILQARLIKGRGMRDQLPTSTGSSKKQESSRKHLFLLY